MSQPDTEFNPDKSVRSFLQIADWLPREVKLFNKYIQRYERTYEYKKLFNTMILFDEMYSPIRKASTYIDASGYIKALNSEREALRSKIYLNKKDLINTVDAKGTRRLVVTSRGHKIFYEEYPLARLRKEEWDGFWTIVMYDIPEKRASVRKYFREKLMRLGFGSPQISILASPLPLADAAHKLIEGEKLERKVWCLRARGFFGMKNEEVAQRAWPLGELNGLYSLLLEVLPKIKEHEDGTDPVEVWRHYFLAVSAADPYLPYELLPEDWVGEKCRTEFVRLRYNRLFQGIFKRIFS